MVEVMEQIFNLVQKNKIGREDGGIDLEGVGTADCLGS